MSLKKIESVLKTKIDELKTMGAFKGKEQVITGVKAADAKHGPRFYIEGFGEKEFIRMNSNSYLGMSFMKELIQAEEESVNRFGTGPGAVRFISGTFMPHKILEKKLAEFHNKESAMIFSSAYNAVMGVLPPLVDDDTGIINDELNHNSIINANRLSRPKIKKIYKHLDMVDLEKKIQEAIGKVKRILIFTDGIFSMRGDYAPLDLISDIAKKYDNNFDEGITTVVDDSHGIGAFGNTGRGTEEYTKAKGIDIIIATLGKALGVNGGYVVSSSVICSYLRETASMYIYSNPITPSEASAAIKSLEIINSTRGIKMLEYLRRLTKKFEKGLKDLGFEIIESDHPIVPLMIRDTDKTSELVNYLFSKGVLSTGLSYPVVPKGDEEIRLQVSADHTEYDIDCVLDVFRDYK